MLLLTLMVLPPLWLLVSNGIRLSNVPPSMRDHTSEEGGRSWQALGLLLPLCQGFPEGCDSLGQRDEVSVLLPWERGGCLPSSKSLLGMLPLALP